MGSNDELFHLRVVSRYRHLGGVITSSGDMSHELGPKMATVRSTARKLRKPFLRDPKVPMATKGQVLQSLVLARGLHLGGCWPCLLPREAKVLNRSIVDMLRPLLGDRPLEQRQADEAVIRELGVLFPIRLVTLLRVQTAIRVAARAPVQLLVLLHASRLAPRSWVRALEADLSHISQASCLEELRGASISKWFCFFRDSPGLARRVVMKAVLATNWPTVEEREAMRETTTYCTICGSPAVDRQALSVHVFRVHKLRRAIRSYVEGLDCLVCGLRFQSRQRLVDHLAEKSEVCSHNYIRRYDPLPPERVAELDLGGRTEYPRRSRLEGAHGVRVHGPFLLVYDLNGSPITSRHPLGPNRRWQG